MLFLARFFALGDAGLPIAHRRDAFFFALRPRCVTATRAFGSGRLRRVIRFFFRLGGPSVEHEHHGWRSESRRRFGNGFGRMRLTGEKLGRALVIAAAKLAHAVLGVFDPIAGLSKRIELEPLVPTRCANGGFDVGVVVEGHAVFEADVAFVEGVDACAAGGEPKGTECAEGKACGPS